MHKHLILFLFILAVTLIPRITLLVSKEDYFGGDFGFYYLHAKQLVIDHKVPLLGDEAGIISGFAQGPGWYYLLSIPFALTNGNPYGGKMLMFLVSIATVIVLSVFFWEKIGKTEAIFVAFLVGLSPYLIVWT